MSFLLIFLFKPLYQDSRIWSAWSPRLKRELHTGAGSWLVISSSSFPDIYFLWAWEKQCTIGRVSWRARKGGPISPSGHIPRHCWQESDGRLPSLKVALGGWMPNTLGSLSDLLTIPFSASHWCLMHFPYIFWFGFYFLLIVILPKSSFHPSFLFFSIFLVLICHGWKRNTRQCDTVRLNLVLQVTDRLYQEKLHTWAHTHTGLTETFTMHGELAQSSPGGRDTCSVQPVSVSGSGQQLSANVMVLPWAICFHEVLDVFRAMPPPSLYYSLVLGDL